MMVFNYSLILDWWIREAIEFEDRWF